MTEEFEPVDLPELLVITGRACARILSGYQKGKSEEGRILEALREEGLLAKPKGKTAGEPHDYYMKLSETTMCIERELVKFQVV